MNINSRSRQTKYRTSADAAGRPRASRRQSASSQPESFRFDPFLRRLYSGQSQRTAVCYIVRFASRYCQSRNGRDALCCRCGDFGASAQHFTGFPMVWTKWSALLIHSWLDRNLFWRRVGLSSKSEERAAYHCGSCSYCRSLSSRRSHLFRSLFSSKWVRQSWPSCRSTKEYTAITVDVTARACVSVCLDVVLLSCSSPAIKWNFVHLKADTLINIQDSSVPMETGPSGFPFNWIPNGFARVQEQVFSMLVPVKTLVRKSGEHSRSAATLWTFSQVFSLHPELK